MMHDDENNVTAEHVIDVSAASVWRFQAHILPDQSVISIAINN